MPNIIILGAGPAGLGAAFQLTSKKLARVTVVEQSNTVGGIAGSFEFSGIRVDYGSHRLHPSCDRKIMRDIKSLLGDDLLNRPRHGRIRLQGKWIHFPLKPFDLVFQLPLSFVKDVLIDSLQKALRRNPKHGGMETFASVLESGLGRTICKCFYFPYSKKIWGLPPEELSPIQAYRRVSANSLRKMLQKILSGRKKSDRGRFFYPKGGFGQISERLFQAAKEGGVKFYLGAKIRSIRINGKTENFVCFNHDGKSIKLRADNIWSTISISDLIDYLEPSPPQSIKELSKVIEYRCLILIYILLEQDRFSEYDAHYFPELDMPITRLSEPKNYRATLEPKNRTVLCAELPCSLNDREWHMSDEELGKIVCDCLESAAIPLKVPIMKAITRRLPQAYPIYKRGYEKNINQIDQWLCQMENLITFGRLGLFVHDNIHHALYMAYAAVKCLNSIGDFDRSRWEDFKEVFETHVVED